jgi:predicted transcriptional regulator
MATQATQNITLALPKRILRRVKLLAAKRRTSVSQLMTQALENLVNQEEGYAQARAHHLRWLEEAVNLGTRGKRRVTREALHER